MVPSQVSSCVFTFRKFCRFPGWGKCPCLCSHSTLCPHLHLFLNSCFIPFLPLNRKLLAGMHGVLMMVASQDLNVHKKSDLNLMNEMMPSVRLYPCIFQVILLTVENHFTNGETGYLTEGRTSIYCSYSSIWKNFCAHFPKAVTCLSYLSLLQPTVTCK